MKAKVKKVKPDVQINPWLILGGVILGACGLLAIGLWSRRSKQIQRSDFSVQGTPLVEPLTHDGRDRVDEASWESFPASDPPAH